MERMEITAALRRFGERSRNIQIHTQNGRASVYVNHEYFGIYDFNRHTFID